MPGSRIIWLILTLTLSLLAIFFGLKFDGLSNDTEFPLITDIVCILFIVPGSGILLIGIIGQLLIEQLLKCNYKIGMPILSFCYMIIMAFLLPYAIKTNVILSLVGIILGLAHFSISMTFTKNK